MYRGTPIYKGIVIHVYEGERRGGMGKEGQDKRRGERNRAGGVWRERRGAGKRVGEKGVVRGEGGDDGGFHTTPLKDTVDTRALYIYVSAP